MIIGIISQSVIIANDLKQFCINGNFPIIRQKEYPPFVWDINLDLGGSLQWQSIWPDRSEISSCGHDAWNVRWTCLTLLLYRSFGLFSYMAIFGLVKEFSIHYMSLMHAFLVYQPKNTAACIQLHLSGLHVKLQNATEALLISASSALLRLSEPLRAHLVESQYLNRILWISFLLTILNVLV